MRRNRSIAQALVIASAGHPLVGQPQANQLALDEVEVPDLDQGIDPPALASRRPWGSKTRLVTSPRWPGRWRRSRGLRRLGDRPERDRSLLRADGQVAAVGREGQGEQKAFGLPARGLDPLHDRLA